MKEREKGRWPRQDRRGDRGCGDDIRSHRHISRYPAAQLELEVLFPCGIGLRVQSRRLASVSKFYLLFVADVILHLGLIH
jgi:hypothetical protein